LQIEQFLKICSKRQGAEVIDTFFSWALNQPETKKSTLQLEAEPLSFYFSKRKAPPI